MLGKACAISALSLAGAPPPCYVGTLDYMAPEVVSLPTAEERRKAEAAGKPLPDPLSTMYDDKVHKFLSQWQNSKRVDWGKVLRKSHQG